MRELRARCWLILLLMLGGCAVFVDTDDGGHDSLDRAIRQASAEINFHYALIDGATSLAGGLAEVERHGRAMDDCTANMRGTMDDMTCDLGGMDGMRGLAVSLDARVSVYVTAARSAPTLEALRELCRQYARDMDDVFERMHDRAGAMDCH